MIIELVGASGSGKTFYSELLKKEMKFDRIQSLDLSLIGFIKIAPRVVMISLKLKPKYTNLLRVFRHVFFMMFYNKLPSKNIILDQGVIYHFSKIHRLVELEFDEIYACFFKKYQFTYPDIVIEIISKKELIFDRRLKRGKSMEKKLKYKPELGYTSLGGIKKDLIDNLSIPHLKYISENDDKENFLSFINQKVIY